MLVKRGVAAVALALALAGIVGSGWQGADSIDSETTELAGGTWS